MKSVHVLYNKQHQAALERAEDSISIESVTVKGIKFAEHDHVDIGSKQYTVVGTHQLDEAWTTERILRWVIKVYSQGPYPSKISAQIKNGTLTTSHASFSPGDIVQIEDRCYYLCEDGHFHVVSAQLLGDDVPTTVDRESQMVI